MTDATKPAATMIPLLDLHAQYAPLRDEILAAITRVCDSQRFIMGPEITALESEIAALLGVSHAVAVSSGTDALLLALMALDIKAGDEVVTPTYSFFATAGAIARVGARPVLVDIDPGDVQHRSRPAIAAAITPRTKAIMPVHLFGLSADLDPILAMPPAPAFRSSKTPRRRSAPPTKARPVGGIGAFGCFSFFPSKNLGAFGDAGLLTTNDAALAHKARLLRTHGMEPKYYHHLVGANFRMDALAGGRPAGQGAASGGLDRGAAVERAALRDAVPRRRRRRSRDAAGRAAGYRHIFNQFVIRTPDRDGLKRISTRTASATRSTIRCRSTCSRASPTSATGAATFPHAERAANESLAIPIYGELTTEQQQTVVEAIAEFVDHRGSPDVIPTSWSDLASDPAHHADLHRPAARHRRRLPLAVVRRGDPPAGRRLPADDQDDHRAAAVLDAGRRHRRHAAI